MVLLCLTSPLVEAASPQNWTNDLLAHFRFASDGKDNQGKCKDADLRGTRFEGSTLFLNGGYEHGGLDTSFRAIAQIEDLSYESLTFSLDFCPLDFNPRQSANGLEGLVAFLNHFTGKRTPSRSGHEIIIMGGTSYRWLGYRYHDGCLELTLNNQDFIHRFTNVVVSVKTWHKLACSFDLKSRRVLTFLDGRELPAANLPEDFKLRIIDSEGESGDKEFTFTNYSDGGAFHGYAANLRVFSRALTESAIRELLAATLAETPKFEPPFKKTSYWLLLLPPLLLVVAGAVVWLKSRKRQGNAIQS
jgi:hypothetical protein